MTLHLCHRVHNRAEAEADVLYLVETFMAISLSDVIELGVLALIIGVQSSRLAVTCLETSIERSAFHIETSS